MYSVGNSGCRIVSKNSQPLLPILSPIPLYKRLQIACDLFFWPSGNSVCHYILHSWDFLCVVTPSARDFQPTHPHRLIHETAATLSPHNNAGSPGVFGLSCKMTCVTRAVITMTQSSTSRLIVIASTPFIIIWFLNSSVRWWSDRISNTPEARGKIHRLQ